MKREPINLTKKECSDISSRFAMSYDDVLGLENSIAYRIRNNEVKPTNEAIILSIEIAIRLGIPIACNPMYLLQGTAITLED